MTKIILFANTDWYLYNFRLLLARRIRERGLNLVLISPPGPYAEKLQAEGFHWKKFPLSRRGLNPLSELRSLADVWRLYRRERPDLVHHFTIKPILYGSLAARRLGIPAVVNSVTGLGYLFVNQGLLATVLRYLIKPIYRAAMGYSHSKVIFQNMQDQDLFIRMGVTSKDKTVVIPGSGVDVTRFAPQPEPAGGDLVVLMASRMLWDKGVAELVEAAQLLRQHKPRARFILVGRPDEGNPASIPESRLRSWHDEGVIEWWGHREDMPHVLASCHVVVLPSYGEGLPRILIEAAAAGKPIVATDVPGCREIVRHGANGLLVPLKDPIALADAIRRCLTDPALRSRMGRAGREMVLQRFAEEVVNKQTINIYQQLLPQGFG